MANYGTSTLPPKAKTFVDGVLSGINAPINASTETAMYWWLANEQGGPSLTNFTYDQGNPLGVQTSSAASAGSAGNVQGGIDSTVSTLKGGNYNALVAAFRQGNSPSAIAQQIVASPWNGNHYGGIKQFLATAGAPNASSGLLFPVSPVIAGSNPNNLLGTPGSPQAGAATTGCAAKGNAFGEGGVLGVGSFHVSYCELKALIGAACLAAGGTLVVIGLVTIVVGGLGGKNTVPSVLAASPVGRATSGTLRVASKVGGSPRRQYKKNKAADAEPQEKAA